MKTKISNKSRYSLITLPYLVIFSLVMWISGAEAMQPGANTAKPAPIASANAANGGAKILPPQSIAYGKTLTEWQNAYWEWNFSFGVYGPTTPQPPKIVQGTKVALLPIPSLASGEATSNWSETEHTGHWNDPVTITGIKVVTIKPGTPLVVPAFGFSYECYGPTVKTCTSKDANGIPVEDDTVKGLITEHNLTLDGSPILQGEKFWNYYVAAEFNPPIWYPQLSDYGSTGVWYSQGVGFVIAPLSVGDHKLIIKETYILQSGIIPDYDWGIIYDNTWTIHVVPPGKQ
jgi:hypothetical protein